MNGRSFAATLWRRRWTVLVAVLVVAAATAACLLFAPRSYTATTRITATPTPGLALPHGTVVDLQRSLAALADSGSVLSDVRDEVGPRRTVRQLQDEVSAELVEGTVLIRISVEDRDRVYARDVANAIADVLPRHDPTGGRFTFATAARATVPSDFSTPDITEVIIAGIAAAILLALGTALAQERRSGKVEDARQLAALTGVPVLAGLPRPADPAEQPADSGTAPVAADFRVLRVALEFASRDDPTSVIVVAPVDPEAAAAWTTLNLAGALARVDHRVLVIDADFGARHRHPAFKSKGPGLAEVMRGEVELRDAVRPTTLSGVSVLPVGNLGRSSAADLVELQFHKAIGQIDDEVDLVLVHAAPLTESQDARVMAVGNALVVSVAPGKVTARRLRELIGELGRLRLRVLGTVLLGRGKA